MKLTTEQIIKHLFDYNENKEMIDHIIKDNESSQKEFEKYLEVWESSANLNDYQDIDTKGDWEKVRSRMGIKAKSKAIPMRTYFLRIAAILVIAVGLSYFFTKILTSTVEDAQYFEVASAGQIQEVELPDGSIVTLNKNSKIIRNSNFGESNRDVILEGQAFFSVARNEEIPFKVHTLNSTIEVLGTKFDIRSDSSIVTVGVLSGKVAFYESANVENRIELNKHNTGSYNVVSSKINFSDSFDQNSLAWRTKKFVFRNEPLQNVCEVLAEYYNMELYTDDNVEFIDSINITCSSESLDQVINLINSFLVEDVALMNTGEKLMVYKQ